MGTSRDYLVAGLIGLAVLAIWVFVVEGLVVLQSPPRLPLGLSLSVNAALMTVLVLRARART